MAPAWARLGSRLLAMQSPKISHQYLNKAYARICRLCQHATSFKMCPPSDSLATGSVEALAPGPMSTAGWRSQIKCGRVTSALGFSCSVDPCASAK